MRWVIHHDVDHPTLVVSNDDGTDENRQTVFSGGLESGQRRDGGFNCALDILTCAFGFDVGRLTVLVLEHATGIRNLAVRWNNERDQFGSEPLHFSEFFKSQFQAQTAR